MSSYVKLICSTLLLLVTLLNNITFGSNCDVDILDSPTYDESLFISKSLPNVIVFPLYVVPLFTAVDKLTKSSTEFIMYGSLSVPVYCPPSVMSPGLSSITSFVSFIFTLDDI